MRAHPLVVLAILAVVPATASCRSMHPLGDLEPRSSEPVAAQVVKTIVYVPAAAVVGGLYLATAMAQGCSAAHRVEPGFGPLPGERRTLWE